MADVLIRPTEPGDAARLSAYLRPADLAECRAYGRTENSAAIEASVRRSLLCWTGLVDGELAAVFGVAPVDLLAGIGSPWMLGTPVLDSHSRVLVKATPDYISRMLDTFPHLINCVHTKNHTSVRWLRRLGFTLHEAIPYGAPGEMFYPFELRA